jgi:plastocyanin
MPELVSPPARWAARLLLAFALVVAVAACGGDDDAADTTAAGPQTTASPQTTAAAPAATTAAGGTEAPAGAEVTIADFAFDPATVTVAGGQPLVFTNTDDTTHSVASSTSDLLLSDDLGQGDEFTVTFDTPGTYDYFCGIHGSMAGTVEVTA